MKIYKLTSPNGKVYIGQTKQDKTYDRWQYGSGYSKNKQLYNDILKYGWINFQHEVLEEVETKEEATERERYYILKYKSNDKKCGYNTNTNASSVKDQIETRLVIRNKKTGEIFQSYKEAGEKYGVSGQAISHSIQVNGFCSHCKWESYRIPKAEFKKLFVSQNRPFLT